MTNGPTGIYHFRIDIRDNNSNSKRFLNCDKCITKTKILVNGLCLVRTQLLMVSETIFFFSFIFLVLHFNVMTELSVYKNMPFV